jgi:hypothetical protein
MTRRASVATTVTGSLFGSSFVGIDQLLVESRQRLGVDGAGHITASTDFELRTERDRRRDGERAYTQFVLGLLGQSAGVVELDPDTRRFLVDHIERMSARYELVLEDPDTTAQELARYLSFADDFGLAASDQAAMAALEPVLPTDASGHYGAVSIHYDVRFTEAGLQALFKPLPAEGELRRIVRMTVLAVAIATRDDRRRNRAWAYWTPLLYERWRREGVNFSRRSEPLAVGPVAPSPFRNLGAPLTLRLDVFDLRILETLYRVEDKLVAAVGGLAGLLAIPRPQRPKVFESAPPRRVQLFEQFAEAENAPVRAANQVICRNVDADTGLRNWFHPVGDRRAEARHDDARP